MGVIVGLGAIGLGVLTCWTVGCVEAWVFRRPYWDKVDTLLWGVITVLGAAVALTVASGLGDAILGR